ncbi:MAG TPA: T9SS type A sorting domain-containing protein [Panacibacter sp.]|nr:T9SS type A sorting domain-containing protein [Panacibacter sp.]
MKLIACPVKIINPFRSLNRFSFALSLTITAVLLFACNTKKEYEEEEERAPDADYFAVRNEHYGSMPKDVRSAIIARLELDNSQDEIKAKTAAVPKWKLIGPSNIGGRVTDIEMPRGNDTTIYAGCASGGIFGSTNFGATWSPLFDNATSLAIGDIEIDPNNDNTIYAGTGEPNTGGGSVTYDGNGIYKSVNAGKTWSNIGLTTVGTIGKISVAKTNSNIVYVAAVGNIYQKSTEKGLYKSIDGGSNWTKILYLSDSTSVNDVAVSPVDANVLYATTWERISRPGVRVYGGITTNLYKSINGGTSWTKLLPDDANRGKMTIDIPPTNANKLYVSIANKDGTFNTIYRYDGTTFTNASGGVFGSTSYTWWFGGIKCHPTDENIVYFSDFNLYRTVNGGTSWQTVAASSHVDQHSVFVHPTNISKVVIGNDGGVYTSVNALSNITFRSLPNTQVYDFDVYKSDETFVSAAFQDNSFAHTPNQNASTWQLFGGGDGVEIRINPLDKTETYSSQYGGINIGTNGIGASDRYNWRCPIRLDPVTPSIRYIGTNKVYKFNPSQNKWAAISGDLTNGTGTGNYGTITAIAVAPGNNNYIYSGSDDGQVYVTKNAGTSWQNITTGLPGLWTTFIKTDRTNPEIAYIGFSGYRYGFKDAHIYKTVNAGATWVRISNNLPQMPVNDLEIDPANTGTLYLGTDIGVYTSTNNGTNWTRLGSKMPGAVVSTLNFAVNSRVLYAATYGRSVYKISLPAAAVSADQFATAENAQKDVSVELSPNPAKDYALIKLYNNLNGAIISVYNDNGKLMLSQKLSAHVLQQKINLQNFARGVYHVVCFADNNKSTGKLMVQ